MPSFLKSIEKLFNKIFFRDTRRRRDSLPTFTSLPDSSILAPLPTLGTKRALLIGINYEGTGSALAGCRADSLHLYYLLTVSLGFEDDNVLCLTDAPGMDAQHLPTKANILRELKQKIQETKPGDTLFVSYSGHGSRTGDSNGDEKDGTDETIVPIDHQQIVDDEIRQLFSQLPEGSNVFFLSDSCHSGTVADLKYTVQIQKLDGQLESAILEDNKYADTLANIIHLSGCRDDQVHIIIITTKYASIHIMCSHVVQYSADAFEDGECQGALTWAFIKSMNDNNCEPNLATLLCEIRETLKSNGYDQIPQINSGKKISPETVLSLK
jgi:hypothetical protein